MDAAAQAQLQGLQSVLQEVLDPHTPSHRKREIESSLAQFKHQKGAWIQCCTFMQYTTEPNVLWYSASVLEYTVASLWGSLDNGERSNFRSFLFEYYKNSGTEIAPFVLVKVAKVFADTGKQDWPQRFPNFFDSIYGMLGDSSTSGKGLALLKIAMEECINSRGVFATRSEELRGLLASQVPIVLNHLALMLESWLVSAADAMQQNLQSGNFGSQGSPRGSPLPFSGGSVANGSKTGMNFPVDVQNSAVKALECILQIFGWANLSEVVTPVLLDVLYNYAQLTDHDDAALGTLAIGCFNEMLSNHCLPANCMEYLQKLSHHIMRLLEKVTRTDADGSILLSSLDEGFNSKLTDFLRLFISSHLRRIESDQRFPMNEFLALIFRFTFLQPTPDGFVMCLQVCNHFLEVLVLKAEERGASAVRTYQPSLMLLSSELIKKLRFADNSVELSTFDTTRDEDDSTELEEHISSCLETVGLIAQLFPAHVVQTVIPLYMEDLNKYSHIHEVLCADETGKMQLSLPNAEAQETVYNLTRDVGTMIQAVGRLAAYFSGSLHTNHFQDSVQLVESLIEMLRYSENHKLYALHSSFADVHVQLLFTLKLFAGWFSSCCRAARQSPEDFLKFNGIVLSVISCAWNIVHSPPRVDSIQLTVLTSAVADIIEAFALVVRPQPLLESAELEQILADSSSFQRQPMEIRKVLCSATTHALLSAWHDVPDSDQRWELRQAKFTLLVQTLVGSLPEMAQNISEDAADLCTVLAAVLRAIREQSKTAKRVFMAVFEPLLPILLQMFGTYGSHSKTMSSILDLKLALFESVSSLLPADFIHQAMSTFMQYFSREQFQALAAGGNYNQNQILVTFFGILKLIVQSKSLVYLYCNFGYYNSATFKVFINDIVKVCVNGVFVLTGTAVAIDVKMALYDVLKYILLDHWKFFFPGRISPVKLHRAPESTEEVSGVHEEELSAFMQAFAESFSQSEITPFKANLITLAAINDQKKLFHRPFFRNNFYNGFVEIFLKVICSKTHTLLEDEIYAQLFALAAVDPTVFLQHAVAGFISKVDALDDSQRAELMSRVQEFEDVQSFTKQFQAFCNDIVYVQQQSVR